jgi:hypothetical protein
MKIISWNIRGLGGVVKRKEVQKLIRETSPNIVCLQETKLSLCDDFLCTSLWGNAPHAFFFRPSVGASGAFLLYGILQRLRCGRPSVGSMSYRVMVGFYHQGRNSWWQMFMHLAMTGRSNSCGTPCRFGSSRW